VFKAAKYDIQQRVGRLIEVKLEYLSEVKDLVRIEEELGQAFTRAGAGAVICTDFRPIEVLSPEVGTALTEVFRRDNRRIERSAMLLSPANAIFSLQLERLLREAKNPARRAFRDAQPLLKWLAEILTPDELARAKQMFAA
jgi:hypothetical protein